MDPSDLSDLLGNGQPPIEALVRALKARQLGGVLQVSGNKGLSAAGLGLEQGAQQDLERGVQEQHFGLQTAQLANTLRHQQVLEALGAGRLGVSQQNANTMGAKAEVPTMGFNPVSGAQQVVKAGITPRQPSVLPLTIGQGGQGPGTPPPPRQPSPPPPPADPAALESPNDKRLPKLSEAFKKDMDAASASSRSSFGESARVVFRGARNLALLDQKNPDGSQRQLTEPEWQEVAGGLVAMQTGGVPTQEMMRHALPKDVKGDAASIMSWLTSSPHAPDRQEWIQRFKDNIDREEKTALKLQRDTQLQRLPSHSELFSLFPNRAKLAAKGYGIEPELIDQIRAGKFDPSAVGAGAQPGGGSAGPAALPRKTLNGKTYEKRADGWHEVG